MWVHFLTPVFLHESSRINRCQQHVNDRKWTRIARSLLESQLPLKIIFFFKRMCALHFFFLIVEPCAEFTCYSPLVLCHSHFLSRVNAQQWSPRKDQALHSIGSFRPFLLALFFFFCANLPFTTTERYTVVCVSRASSFWWKKSDFPTAMCFRGRHSIGSVLVHRPRSWR